MLQSLVKSKCVYAISTSKFVLFLLTNGQFSDTYGDFWKSVENDWRDQVKIFKYNSSRLSELSDQGQKSLFYSTKS